MVRKQAPHAGPRDQTSVINSSPGMRKLFATKCLELGKTLVPEENGLNTIELAIFSLGSTKRLALPARHTKKAWACGILAHFYKRPPNTSPKHHCSRPDAPRDTSAPSFNPCLAKVLYLRWGDASHKAIPAETKPRKSRRPARRGSALHSRPGILTFSLCLSPTLGYLFPVHPDFASGSPGAKASL